MRFSLFHQHYALMRHDAIDVLTFLPSASTLDHGISRDATTLSTMGNWLLNISNTVDRRKPRATFADGGSVPNWIVPPH